MAARPVEWVLVVCFGRAAHKATYGRLNGRGYSKDYIQLSRKPEFLEEVAHILSVPVAGTGTVPLTFQWPKGTAPGDFVFKSADRPHLKWETNLGAPPPWRMNLAPTDATPETIPGDPSHTNAEDADAEFDKISDRGGGQPYLMAIKLKDEARILHLRAYLDGPSEEFAWASLALTPDEVQSLAAKTSHSSALAWSMFKSGGIIQSPLVGEVVDRLAASEDLTKILDTVDADTGRALRDYLLLPGDGLFFDPTRNHDAWSRADPLPMSVTGQVKDLLKVLEARFPPSPQGDAAAEKLEVDPVLLEAFRKQIAEGSYAVPDATATVKTRGSAQRAFANAVKANYGHCCAITGVTTKAFLVASHIVPWSTDQDIRLDPSNGICLSVLVDRAFEKGFLTIDDDLTIRVDDVRIGTDDELRKQLQPLHGQSLTPPKKDPPRVDYLQRRRALVATDD